MDSIKIIAAPSVYLIATQAVEESGLSAFLADNGTPDWRSTAAQPGQAIVEVGGRLCYQSFGKPRPGGNPAYLRHILEVGHGSVVEHAVYTLIITGISRSCSHELVRHRHLSPSQLSQRYVDESDVAFVAPPAILELRVDQPSRFAYWRNTCFSALEAYSEMAAILEIRAWRAANPDVGVPAGYSYEVATEWINGLPAGQRSAIRKAAREAARSVLPNAAETKIQLTGNARAWRSFLELRGSRHADAEIRRLAFAILAVLVPAAPDLFGDYRIVDGEGGVQEIATDYRHV